MSKITQVTLTVFLSGTMLLILGVGGLICTVVSEPVDAQETPLEYTFIGKDEGGRELKLWVDKSVNVYCYIITRKASGANAGISCFQGRP